MTLDLETTSPRAEEAVRDAQKWASLLELSAKPEEQLQHCIEFMQKTLAEGSSSKFQEFWEVRRLSLSLFKKNLPPKTRGDLWARYVDLSAEARRLKAILDEQSSFACEQIELAIQSLIQDLDAYEERLSQMPDLGVRIEMPPIAAKKEQYNHLQKQLHLLNALAAKVGALRKEAIRTDMRVRNKNKIFEKLSECGDRIFPPRKELIKKVSQEFLEDIASFAKIYFDAGKKPTGPLHALRDEVKSLQTLAKCLTLNTHSFTETRVSLSFCWETLKVWDKEKKKELTEQKVHQKQAYEDALAKVKEFEQFCLNETSLSDVLKQYEESLNYLKANKDLGSIEFKQLKEMLMSYKRPLEDKQREIELGALRAEKEKESLRLKKVQDVRQEMQSLLEKAGEMSLEEAEGLKASLEERARALTLSKADKMIFERVFKQLKDVFLVIKSQRIFSLSGSSQELSDQLSSLLQEKKARRHEIKEQLETYRKALGGSGFDFEKGMMYKELIESEKEVLEKISLAIEEIEEKMARIEG